MFGGSFFMIVGIRQAQRRNRAALKIVRSVSAGCSALLDSPLLLLQAAQHKINPIFYRCFG